MTDVRSALDCLIRDRGEDYTSLSRLLGRNAAYVQQFIHRGVPRKLAEDDRRRLARYFGIDESVLGGSVPEPTGAVITVPVLEVRAAAGAGALGADERATGVVGFDARWLKRLTGDTRLLSTIQVAGDSMQPTLTDGDDILVDRSDAAGRLRDGVYVLRRDEAIAVKRVAIGAGGFEVLSDNPAYPGWGALDPAVVEVIGRVIWVGRKL